jgi:hypothetical protein
MEAKSQADQTGWPQTVSFNWIELEQGAACRLFVDFPRIRIWS